MNRGIAQQTVRCLALALAAMAIGCSGGGSTSQATAQGVQVSVAPSAPTLFPQQSLTFQATVTGTANTAVDWSVQQGAAGGTIGADGLYTAPTATGTYVVVAKSQAAAGVSGTATVTVIAAEPPPPGSGTMTAAHRTSGVAPLSVFFDAVDTNSEGETYPFTWRSGVYQPTDYEGTLYRWDFGDPGSGAWTQTGNSRNKATGYTAAHVYENPGTYTATLTIIDLQGGVHTYTQTITVTAFSGTTYYVAANGSDANDGRSTATPFLTVNKAMSKIGTNVRILFRRGDTFSTNSHFDITDPGPGIIGAYGSGNRPIIDCSYEDGNGTNIFSPQGTGTDWRIMDLDLRGPSLTGTVGPVGPPVTSQGVDSLYLRLKVTNWNVGIGWGDWTNILTTPHDAIFVVESEAPNPYAQSYYLGGRRLVLLGNLGSDGATTHITRVWQACKAVISNNRFVNPGGTRLALKLHGPSWQDYHAGHAPETRWVSITDNIVSGNAYVMSVEPQDDIDDERITHVVVERNRFTPRPGTDVYHYFLTSGRSIMVRNNVFVATSTGSYHYAIRVWHPGIDPHPRDIRIENNTMYRGDVGSEGYFVQVSQGSSITNLTVRNNLFSYPARSGSAGLFVVDTNPTNWVADHNLYTNAAASTVFTNADGGDFSLPAGSPAVDAGTTLPEVAVDYAGAARPLGAAFDLGAFESH